MSDKDYIPNMTLLGVVWRVNFPFFTFKIGEEDVVMEGYINIPSETKNETFCAMLEWLNEELIDQDVSVEVFYVNDKQVCRIFKGDDDILAEAEINLLDCME
jgi:hypothetical protein